MALSKAPNCVPEKMVDGVAAITHSSVARASKREQKNQFDDEKSYIAKRKMKKKYSALKTMVLGTGDGRTMSEVNKVQLHSQIYT